MVLLGMYNEFGPGMGLPSIKDSFQAERYPGQDMIIEYLRTGGEVCMARPGSDIDKFTGEKIGFESYLKNDGEYSWYSYLSYYVDKYNLRLPEDFEQHVRKRMAA